MPYDNIFFCEVARVSVKVIEINNNTEVNSFSIFRVNFQFSVRFEINILLCPAAGHGLNKFAAPLTERPKVEGGQSSWPKYIKMVHLVFCESFNGRYNRYSDRFLLEKRSDPLLALLDILKIFHSQMVTRWRHRYLPKTYLWLSAVFLEMSLSQKSRKLALKPCR